MLGLGTHWRRESTDFTPWLAQEENIQLLSKTILPYQMEQIGPSWAYWK
jgi:hypothetical protein